ncbi:MAG: trypsin-like peptidase domain-containing protein [Anaerolineales bacterium]|nr:trypsin-like peptidase domain-containing protein [Anaerolineales bacterium]
MKNRSALLLVVALLVLSALACSINPQAWFSLSAEPIQQEIVTTISTVTLEDGDLPALYQEINPGVVAIRALTEEGGGLGTGFVWDAEGHIVTNFHVVQSATDLEVDFPSGFKTRARVLGSDPDTDLAVLELDQLPVELRVLTLGQNQDLKVGQTVIAIGNPQGLDGTMTQGIISALGRTLESMHFAPGGGAFATGNIIQTDAAINPGNSGGPLINLKGEVVGINSAISTTSIDSSGQPVNSGLGFAISIDTAKNVLQDLIAVGTHDSPYVGIQVLSELSLFDQEELDLPQSTGVYILEVSPGSPAEKAGLVGAETGEGVPVGGDLIIAIDDQPVDNFEDFMGYLLTYKKPGDLVIIHLIRETKTIELELTLEKRP